MGAGVGECCPGHSNSQFLHLDSAPDVGAEQGFSLPMVAWHDLYPGLVENTFFLTQKVLPKPISSCPSGPESPSSTDV